MKNFWQVFVNRNERFLPLQCLIEIAGQAVFKGKNCEI